MYYDSQIRVYPRCCWWVSACETSPLGTSSAPRRPGSLGERTCAWEARGRLFLPPSSAIDETCTCSRPTTPCPSAAHSSLCAPDRCNAHATGETSASHAQSGKKHNKKNKITAVLVLVKHWVYDLRVQYGTFNYHTK